MDSDAELYHRDQLDGESGEGEGEDEDEEEGEWEDVCVLTAPSSQDASCACMGDGTDVPPVMQWQSRTPPLVRALA